MPDVTHYARYFLSDCLFLTLETVGHEPVLNDEPGYHALRGVLNRVKRSRPFEAVAFVLVPDHVHLLIRPGKGVNADSVVRPMMAQFEQDRRQMLGMPSVEQIWQRSYSMRRVHDVDEFAVVLDSIHYNPVHHGLVIGRRSGCTAAIRRGSNEASTSWGGAGRCRTACKEGEVTIGESVFAENKRHYRFEHRFHIHGRR